MLANPCDDCIMLCRTKVVMDCHKIDEVLTTPYTLVLYICRKQAAPYSHECLGDPKVDCSSKVNINCPSCGIYVNDALKYPPAGFHITQPGSSHQLVSTWHPHPIPSV